MLAKVIERSLPSPLRKGDVVWSHVNRAHRELMVIIETTTILPVGRVLFGTKEWYVDPASEVVAHIEVTDVG